MISITTNLQSMIVRSNLRSATNGINSTLERMTTGFKLNRAKDNAAGVYISNNTASKLSSYQVAQDNADMGLSYLSTTEGNLELIAEHLIRIRNLTEQAANDTYSTTSREAIQAEINERQDEIYRVINTAEYNGQKIFIDRGALATLPPSFTAGDHDPIPVTPNMNKCVSKVSSFTSGETYYITSATDLVALQDKVNSGATTAGVTFELAAHIDMTGVEFQGIGGSKQFKGTFNGNNYVITNLTISNPSTTSGTGFFNKTSNATIKNIILTNCSIKGQYGGTGGLIGSSNGDTIDNCLVEGTVKGSNGTGGFIGSAKNVNITNSFTKTDVTGYHTTGGFIGGLSNGTIENCFSDSGTITATSSTSSFGGFIGTISEASSGVTINNCYSTNKLTRNNHAAFISNGPSANAGNVSITNCNYNPSVNPGMNAVKTPNGIDTSGITAFTIAPESPGIPKIPHTAILSCFVGITQKECSFLTVDTTLNCSIRVDVSNSNNARNALEDIDKELKAVNKIQTAIGANSNRLESVYDSLSVNIQNLTSSLSTIRDADISKEGTEYIQQQILQNACATLLSTANQTPSIALSLI